MDIKIIESNVSSDITLSSGAVVLLSRGYEVRDHNLRAWVRCSKCNEERYVNVQRRSDKHWSGNCLKCLSKSQVASSHPNWKGGRTLDKSGYVMLHKSLLSPEELELCKDELSNHGYLREHRLVMAKLIHRPLLKTEIVHHLNGIKDDNNPSNLKLLNPSSHNKAEREWVQSLQLEIKRLQDLLTSHSISY